MNLEDFDVGRAFSEFVKLLPSRCAGCGEEIDPRTCWCGVEEEQHDPYCDPHPFVPIGCTCGFDANRTQPPTP